MTPGSQAGVLIVAGQQFQFSLIIFRRLGMALGGEAGARLAVELGLAVSADTLLRELKRADVGARATPRVLGVDDFAFRRGHRYGTLLVDLERGEPVDLLPDRTGETLAQWLREHPGVEIISRDRSSAYADGARQGAPAAQQVADRWHLLKNLVEALEATVTHQERTLVAVDSSPAGVDSAPVTRVEAVVPEADAAAAAANTDSPASSAPGDITRGEVRRRQLYGEVQCLRGLGWSQRAIAPKLGQPVRTVQRHARAPVFPARKRRTRPAGQLAPYHSYLEQRLDQGCRNAAQLWRELREQGFRGSYSAVYAWITEQYPQTADGAPDQRCPRPAPTPRQVTWWLVRRPEQLTSEQAAFVEALQERSPMLHQARELVLEFFALARKREGHLLEDWVTRTQASGIVALRTFALGLRRDWDAVIAGMTLSWSNGPVEGQVNRLKLLKRQMYGRASFPLLRARVLHSG